ncbi:BglG family transcription antiterminator [Listeria kieliensis]|nr:BglG family transcription antiterminator [Listeria kieliensis]
MMSRYKLSKLIPVSHIRIEEAASLTGLPEEKLLQFLEEFNHYLPKSLLEQTHGRLTISEEAKSYFPDFLVQLKDRPLYFEESERMKLIYLMTFSCYQELSVFYYQSVLKVSKNTILSDIKKLRKLLAASNIELAYDRKQGFFLVGAEWEIRKQAFHWVNALMERAELKWLLFTWIYAHDFEAYTKVRDRLEQATELHTISMIPSRLEGFYILICLLKERSGKGELNFDERLTKRIQQTAVYQIASELWDTENEEETQFLTILLLTLTQGQLEESVFDFLLDCANRMLQELERSAAVHFEEYRKLLLDTFSHLVPAYFRVYYGLEMEEPFLYKVENDYPEIYALTERALVPLEKLVGRPIPKGEKAYFALLFGAAIQNQEEKEQSEQLHALIICPNGISTSMIMEAELKRLFPTITFHTQFTPEKLEQIPTSSYQLIFSSVKIEAAKPVFKIRPIMDPVEKHQLVKAVQETFLIPGMTLVTPEEIIQTLLPYFDLKKGVTKEKIAKILGRKMMKVASSKEDSRPMLTELLTEDHIQVTDEKWSWEEAITEAARPLLPEYIEEKYIQAMIQKVNDYGAFIHIGKGVALPHARPDEGVKKMGMALLKTKEPVLLLNDAAHPISIFICLAAVDNEAHLRALASLTKILSDKKSLDKLLQAETKTEIIQIMKEKEGEEEE